MGGSAPKFYGLPKIKKLDTPLRPMESSCGLVTCCMAKELTKIFKPLVGKSPHHINSTQDFVETGQKCNTVTWGMLQLLWCYSSVHLSPSGSSPRYYQGSTGKWPYPQGKNSIISWGYNSPIGILPQKYFLSKASSMNRLRVWLWVPQ